MAGAACVFFCYRLLTALKIGIYYGDGDMDVHADAHPAAFVLTVLSSLFLIVLLAFFASGLDGPKLAAAVRWISQALH